MVLDSNSPYLGYNLARLEKRFLNRYNESLEKERIRKEQSKPKHKTNLKSIEANKERLDSVRMIRQFYTENTKKVFQSEASINFSVDSPLGDQIFKNVVLENHTK